MNLRHQPLLIGLRVASLLMFGITVFFNFTSGGQIDIGIFENTQATLSAKYYLEITPAGWTFSIWGLIYIWQALWIIYSLISVSRTGPQGPLYLNPVLLSPVFFLVYILNLGCNIGWLFVFDREHLGVACGFLCAIALTLYICLGLSYTALERNKAVLASSGRKVDDILVRAFVHNGLGIYAAWTTIASFLNIGFVIAYRSDPVIPQSTASSAALAGIAFALVVFVATDLTVLDKFSRYTITPYLVILWALGGSLAMNYDLSKTNTIFSLVLIAVAAVALIVKIICVIARWNSKPIFLRVNGSNEKGDIRM